MEVIYTQTRDDVWAFQKFHVRRSKQWLYGFGVFGNVALGLMWALLTWLFVRRLLFLSHLFGGGALTLWWRLEQRSVLLWLLFTLYLAYSLWGSKWLAMHRAVSAPDLAERKTLRLTPEGLGVTTPRQQVTIAWKTLREIAADRQRLYFYLTPSNAVVVPKRAFASPEEAVAFETAARRFRAEAEMFAGGEAAPGVWPPPPKRAVSAPPPPSDVAPEPEPELAAVSYVTRRADLWRSSLLLARQRPATLLNLAVPCLFPAALLVFFSHDPALPVFGVAVLAWLALVWHWLRTVVVSRMPDAKAERPCRSALRADAFVVTTPEGRAVLPWREVGSLFTFLGDLHVRRRNGLGGSFIPRTAFASAAEAQAFLSRMQECWETACATPAVVSGVVTSDPQGQE